MRPHRLDAVVAITRERPDRVVPHRLLRHHLEPWHADIETWLDLKKEPRQQLERARDLFYGLWIPDLFMRAEATTVVVDVSQRVPRAGRLPRQGV